VGPLKEANSVNKERTNLNTALEKYLKSGRQFGDGEKFYLLGFEAALHARNRCKEFDQIASEMTSDLEELQQQYPGCQQKSPSRAISARAGILRLCDESNPASRFHATLVDPPLSSSGAQWYKVPSQFI
jgi:hypothetical protein